MKTEPFKKYFFFYKVELTACYGDQYPISEMESKFADLPAEVPPPSRMGKVEVG